MVVFWICTSAFGVNAMFVCIHQTPGPGLVHGAALGLAPCTATGSGLSRSLSITMSRSNMLALSYQTQTVTQQQSLNQIRSASLDPVNVFTVCQTCKISPLPNTHNLKKNHFFMFRLVRRVPLLKNTTAFLTCWRPRTSESFLELYVWHGESPVIWRVVRPFCCLSWVIISS